MELKITRIINRKKEDILLTKEELEEAYKKQKREYLREDIKSKIEDNYQKGMTSFQIEHIEKIPEIWDWIYNKFEELEYSCENDISYIDLVELALENLEKSSKTPAFFF